MQKTQTMIDKLTAALDPEFMDLKDVSESHRGHAGYQEGGESHFHLVAVSVKFEGLNKLGRQRMVYEVLAEEMKGAVHALSMDLKSPSEAS